ncbi:putative protein kinase RLK-Pelle-WAK family [Helianthus anomalus]
MFIVILFLYIFFGVTFKFCLIYLKKTLFFIMQYIFLFFSFKCVFFFSGPRFFCAYRLGPNRCLCVLSAPSAFDNYDRNYISDCLSRTNCTKLAKNLCYGQGCMQVPLPFSLTKFRIHTQRVTRQVGSWSFNNCTYAFLARKMHYKFKKEDLDSMQNQSLEVSLVWTSLEIVDEGHPGYSCRCAHGYHEILFESKQPSNTAKIFAARILKKATNNFHKTNVIGQGGYGTVYKGTLEDKTMVAIKQSKSIDKNQIKQFINEVIMLSEVNHSNIVRLLGCCLETQTPLLVYEFVTNKTLYHHLHEKDYDSSMTFERRLNIATQTLEALAHIHSTTQIIHRDIKSSNILLTDDYTVKVSDFGISKFIPMDQTHIQTLVHGTLGYMKD